MAQHLLAIFGAATAKPPYGLHPKVPGQHDATEAEAEAAVRGLLAKAFAAPPAHMVLPGKGCGFGYVASEECSYAERAGVHVLCSMPVPPAGEPAAGAEFLLDFYDSFANTDQDDEVLEAALTRLGNLQGAFAFVIYDSEVHRVLAARDEDGKQPLFWGSTADGQLLFGTCLDDLDACEPTATPFPAGSLFAAVHHARHEQTGPAGWVIAGEDVPGELASFLRADVAHWRHVAEIPRLTSEGCVSGAVYRVSSKPDFAHTAPPLAS